MITMRSDNLELDESLKLTIEKSVSDVCILNLYSSLFNFSVSKSHKDLNVQLKNLPKQLKDDYSKSLLESISTGILATLDKEEQEDPVVKEYLLLISTHINKIIGMYVESFTLVVEQVNSIHKKTT